MEVVRERVVIIFNNRGAPCRLDGGRDFDLG